MLDDMDAGPRPDGVRVEAPGEQPGRPPWRTYPHRSAYPAREPRGREFAGEVHYDVEGADAPWKACVYDYHLVNEWRGAPQFSNPRCGKRCDMCVRIGLTQALDGRAAQNPVAYAITLNQQYAWPSVHFACAQVLHTPPGSPRQP